MINSLQGMKVYFIGIGGIGMSSLALYLKRQNFIVLGSDKNKSKQTKLLEDNNIKVNYVQNIDDVKSSDIVVYSSAISNADVEFKMANSLNKPIYKRSQLLNLILSSFNKSVGISGSHGKTTITAMISNILYTANKSFTAFIGGVDNKFSNFYSDGNKSLVISEVCEFKKSIYDVNVDIAICSNVDNDHLDSYGDIINIKNAFYDYLDRSQYRIICNDDKYLKDYKKVNTITYGIKNQSDIMAKNITELLGKYSFNLVVKGNDLGRVNLNVFGKYSVYNALCAVSACYLIGISSSDVLKGLASFNGVERRFEYVGKLFNKNIIVDYAHHPTEIKSTLKTAKQVFSNDLRIIFEPHTYSRTKILFYDFVNVFEKEKVAFYKTFSAREDYVYDGSSEKLAISIDKKYLENFSELIEYIKKTNENNVLILGAGELYGKIISQIKNS